VAIAVDHFASILGIVLELDCHVTVHFTDEKVEWLSRWFQYAALWRVLGSDHKNSLPNHGVRTLEIGPASFLCLL
jgi:hypothetical protein